VFVIERERKKQGEKEVEEEVIEFSEHSILLASSPPCDFAPHRDRQSRSVI